MIRVDPRDPRECTLLLASIKGPKWRESCRFYCSDGVFLPYITPSESLKILRSRFDDLRLTDKDVNLERLSCVATGHTARRWWRRDFGPDRYRSKAHVLKQYPLISESQSPLVSSYDIKTWHDFYSKFVSLGMPRKANVSASESVLSALCGGFVAPPTRWPTR